LPGIIADYRHRVKQKPEKCPQGKLPEAVSSGKINQMRRPERQPALWAKVPSIAEGAIFNELRTINYELLRQSAEEIFNQKRGYLHTKNGKINIFLSLST